MAKRANHRVPEQKMMAAQAAEILHNHPELQAFANMMKALIDARTGPVDRLDELMIPVTLITGEEIHVTVPSLTRPIVTDDDPRLEAFRNIVRISVAQAPTVYRLANSAAVQTKKDMQVTSP